MAPDDAMTATALRELLDSDGQPFAAGTTASAEQLDDGTIRARIGHAGQWHEFRVDQHTTLTDFRRHYKRVGAQLPNNGRAAAASLRRSLAAAFHAIAQPPNASADGQPGELVDLAPKGLGAGEQIYRRWTFDGQDYAMVGGPRQSDGHPSWTRSARLDRPTESTPDKPAKPSTLVPILNGRLSIQALSETLVVTRNPETDRREIITDRITGRCAIAYLDPAGRQIGSTDITTSELLGKGATEWAWLDRLRVTKDVRQNSGRFAMIRDLLHAECQRAESDLADGKAPLRIGRVVRETGLLWDTAHERFVFAMPSGAVITATGGADNLVSKPDVGTQNRHLLAYGRGSDPTIPDADGLAAYRELVDLAPGNRAAILTMQGGQISGIVGSLFEDARGADAILGLSRHGKTSIAMGIVSAQSGIIDPDAVKPSVSMLSGDKKTKIASFPGVRSLIEGLSGITLLLDECTKRSMPVDHLKHAHGSLITPILMGAAPGQAPPPQATVRKDSDRSRVVPSDVPPTESHLILAMEVLPFAGRISEDSVFNRAVVIHWDKSQRCDPETFKRLMCVEHNRRAFAGYLAIVRYLLADPGRWMAAYRDARRQLAEIDDARARDKYANRLAGLTILEQVCALHGLPAATDDLAAVFVAAAESEARQGTDCSETRAQWSIPDSWREVDRGTLDAGRGYLAGKKASVDDADQPPFLTSDGEFAPPDELDGLTLEMLGWKRAGQDSEQPFKPARFDAQRLGTLMAAGAAAGGRATKAHDWPYVTRFTEREWKQHAQLIRTTAERRGWATAESSNALRAELVAAGVASHRRIHGWYVTEIDAQWRLVEPIDQPDDQEADDDGS